MIGVVPSKTYLCDSLPARVCFVLPRNFAALAQPATLRLDLLPRRRGTVTEFATRIFKGRGYIAMSPEGEVSSFSACGTPPQPRLPRRVQRRRAATAVRPRIAEAAGARPQGRRVGEGRVQNVHASRPRASGPRRGHRRGRAGGPGAGCQVEDDGRVVRAVWKSTPASVTTGGNVTQPLPAIRVARARCLHSHAFDLHEVRPEGRRGYLP